MFASLKEEEQRVSKSKLFIIFVVNFIDGKPYTLIFRYDGDNEQKRKKIPRLLKGDKQWHNGIAKKKILIICDKIKHCIGQLKIIYY